MRQRFHFILKLLFFPGIAYAHFQRVRIERFAYKIVCPAFYRPDGYIYIGISGYQYQHDMGVYFF